MIKIGDGACYSKDSIVRTSGQVHFSDRHFQCPLAWFIKSAELPQLGVRDLSVTETAEKLNLPGFFDSFPDLRGSDAVTLRS
jgi:hypothetical protein